MRWRRCLVAALVGLIALPGVAAAASLRFHSNSRATFQSPGGWDEPSGIGSSAGQLFVASQNPNATPDVTLSQSADGLSWSGDAPYTTYLSGRAEGQTGDVTMASDRAGTVFIGHLTGALQADIDWSRDGGKTWHTANDIATIPSPAAGSNSPFLVDRPWIAAYSPDTNFKDTTVYLEYHDFVTSAVYIVTCSMATGSLQCGSPVAVSNLQTACNSIPGGVAVSPAGSAHPGRVFAVWSTADPLTNAVSGCNYTQLAPFYAVYVAWSDNPSQPGSWHQSAVYIGPTGGSQNCPDTALVGAISTNTCADVSELFTPIAVDRAGNAYVSFVDYISTLHPAYDVYLARSTDGGSTWDGSANGSGTPVLVSNDGGTHFVPNLVAGSDGRVALIYYTTSYTGPTVHERRHLSLRGPARESLPREGAARAALGGVGDRRVDQPQRNQWLAGVHAVSGVRFRDRRQLWRHLQPRHLLRWLEHGQPQHVREQHRVPRQERLPDRRMGRSATGSQPAE